MNGIDNIQYNVWLLLDNKCIGLKYILSTYKMIYSFLFFTTFIIVNSIKTYRKALNVFQLALSNDASIPYVGNSNDVVSIP